MRRLLALVLVLASAAACDDTEPGGPFGTSRVERKEVQFGGFAEVDVLIVVDRSPAMAPFRTELTTQAAQIAAMFETLPRGMPDVHIGVVTSDLGAEGVAVPGCTGDGDGGTLRTVNTVNGAFLSDVVAADGSRVRNYQGTLADALEDLLDVGADGCPYSRPLAAAQRALDNTVANAGFLREDAYLAVVFVTAQDDCSFADASFLDGSTSTDTTRCVTGANALPALDGFVETLKGRKADPAKVMVGGVIGAAPPACGEQVATRLHAFLQMFPNRQDETSICGDRYVDAFATIAQQDKITLGVPCWETELLDGDPMAPGLQPECSASYTLPDGTEDLLPACAPGGDGVCWRIVDDEVNCPSSGLSLEIDTHGRAYRPGTRATIECLVAE